MEAALEAKRKEAEADAEVAAANEAAKFAAAALAPPEAPPDWLARNTAAPPLDLTFSKLRLCADIASAEERKDDTRANSRASSRASSRPLSRMGGVRNSRYEYDINAVTSARLNNNKLTCLEGLADALVPRLQPFQIAQQLLWLDLSFNLLTDVEPALLAFPCLKVLYLHSNRIKEDADWESLQALSALANLSIHDNPLDNKPNINRILVTGLPLLKKLNFAPVTPQFKADAEQWAASVERARKKKDAGPA